MARTKRSNGTGTVVMIPMETTVEDFIANPEMVEVTADHFNRDETGRILEPQGGDYRPGYNGRGERVAPADAGMADATEATADRPKARKAEQTEAPAQRFCPCGCGRVVGKKAHFGAGGCDQRFKGQLLARFDAGDRAAGEELVERGWRSWEELNERGTKTRATADEVAAGKRAKVQARVDRLRFQLAEAEQELANL